MQAIRIEVVRGKIIEATHLVHAVALDGNGKICSFFGDPNLMTYWRSSAKPFQAIAVVATKAVDHFGLTSQELAIACGSHSGSAKHIEVVKSILAKAELTEKHLLCGVHEPFDPSERDRLCIERQKPSPLHNNCSGKHSAMLASTKCLGEALDKYLDPQHSTQQIILRCLSEATGDPNLSETVIADGCGAPIWASSIQSIALAFHRFVKGSFSFGDEAKRIIEAMALHPDMISAEGTWNTRIIQATKGKFVGKGGAEGLFAGAFIDGRAISIKVEDGNHRPIPIATVALLKHLDWLTDDELSALSNYVEPPQKNLHGQRIGFLRTVLS